MNITVLSPVFNDWESCRELIKRARLTFSNDGRYAVRFVVINDGSADPVPEDLLSPQLNCEIVNLNVNVGHQRAIALGLCYVHEYRPCDYVIVMDADGEDKPEDIPRLIEEAVKAHGKIIFGTRQRRYEGLLFRFCYVLYKIIFRMLTGKRISFGNFCAIPYEKLRHIVYVSDLWNHFSGGLIRSRIPYTSIPLERGIRYYGSSKMNFISLIIHGLSAISVYTDTLAVRSLLVTFAAICVALCGIITVACIRFFTPLAIPGWASFVTLSFLIIIFQAFLISLLLIFSVLSYRTQSRFIPALSYKSYIQNLP